MTIRRGAGNRRPAGRVPSPMPALPIVGSIEPAVVDAVRWLRLAIDVVGAIVIGVGVAIALWGLARAPGRRQPLDFTAVRLDLARYLALALEFQLGADILTTAVAPSWDQIGKLGAIAVIRTTLNYFLMRELREAGEMAASGALG
jgi:uncharacterized membrane protein